MKNNINNTGSIRQNRSTSLDRTTSREGKALSSRTRSASLGSITTGNSERIVNYQQAEQINFLDNLAVALKKTYPKEDFSFLNTFQQQIKQSSNFNSEKFKEDFNKKLEPYRVTHGLCNTFEYKSCETDDKKKYYISETISTNCYQDYSTLSNIFVSVYNKNVINIKNSLLEAGVVNEWCSDVFKKYEELSTNLVDVTKEHLTANIYNDKLYLNEIGFYKPQNPNYKNKNISGKEFFNYLVPLDVLQALQLDTFILSHNINYNPNKSKEEQIVFNEQDKKLSKDICTVSDLAKKRGDSIYLFTIDTKMKGFTDPQDKKDYIFSTGKYAATEEYGATGLLEVIQDYENNTAYVKDSLETKAALQKSSDDKQTRKAQEELFKMLDTEKNTNTQKKSTGGGKKKKNNFKKNKTQEPKKITPKQLTGSLQSVSKADEHSEDIDGILSLEGFIEVENNKKRVILGEYNIPTLNEFLDDSQYMSFVNPSKDDRNISIIKVNKNDDTPQNIKIYLSKYSQTGNAFINHIKDKHDVFYQWACDHFDDKDSDNLAKKLLQTALNTLKEGKGDVSITNKYVDDRGITHDVQALQIQVPIKDTHDNTEHDVILRLQKDRYNRLVLVTAFEQGKAN